MSEIKINAALVSAYLACGVMPRERTEFEGVGFKPVTGQSWARITDLPSSNDPAGLGQYAPDERLGILQIDLLHPKGSGTAPILGDAQRVLQYFNKGRRLEYDGQVVKVRKSQRSQIRTEELWQSVSVDVHYITWIFPQ